MNTTAQTGKKFNYLYGLINLVAVFCIVWLWVCFHEPQYNDETVHPQYGLSLVVGFLAAIVLLNNVAGGIRFRKFQRNDRTVQRGIVMTLVAVLLMLFLVSIFFWGFIGKFGIAYFSPQSIIASGGQGVRYLTARENASTAIVYYFTGLLLAALFWSTGLG